MAAVMNVGLIECEDFAKHQLDNSGVSTQYHIKKVFSKNNPFASDHYPKAELVDDAGEILNDRSIDLVIISSSGNKGKEIASEALGAGKNVRIL